MGRTNDGGPGAVRLRLTPLEDRTLPASGVAASLSSGLLKITDYKAVDAGLMTTLLPRLPEAVRLLLELIEEAKQEER